MKLATCTVSLKGYVTINNSEQRLDLLKDAVKKVQKKGVNLICFPGGYLFVKSKQRLNELAAEIFQLAKHYKIAIVTGIDLKQKDYKISDAEAIKRGNLPYFAVCATPDSKDYNVWYQRSITSKDQVYTPNRICSEVRTIKVLNKSIEILLCGEIFNQRIRNSFIKRKVDAVIDLAHISLQFRIDGSMKVIAKNGIASFCSVHADMKGAMKRSYSPKRNSWCKNSTRGIDILVGKSPRIEIKIWKI